VVAVDYDTQHAAHNERDLKRNMVREHKDWTYLSQGKLAWNFCAYGSVKYQLYTQLFPFHRKPQRVIFMYIFNDYHH
jgi:hypothetical protein